MPQLHLRVRRLAVVRHHDAVSARSAVRWRRHVPDEYLGARQAPKLQEGVQGLPKEAQGHRSVRSVSGQRTAL